MSPRLPTAVRVRPTRMPRRPRSRPAAPRRARNNSGTTVGFDRGATGTTGTTGTISAAAGATDAGSLVGESDARHLRAGTTSRLAAAVDPAAHSVLQYRLRLLLSARPRFKS